MDAALDYVPLGGERHRHGATVHSHPIAARTPILNRATTITTTDTATATA